MIYYAVDPGFTTGLAWLTDYDGSHAFGNAQVEGRHELYRQLDKIMDTWPEINFIVERWDVRPNTHRLTNQDDPRYIIGWLEGECHRRGIPYHEQKPAQAKSFADDIKLQKAGMYAPGMDHARDASRHLLTFLVKAKTPAGAHVRELLTR